MNEKKETLQNEYKIRFSKMEHYRNEVWKILCDDFFSKFILPKYEVLDLGTGWGEFINNIVAKKKYAMDLNPDSGLRSLNEIIFLEQDCSQEWQIQSDSLDIVFTSNFLEHLPQKDLVQKTISEAYRCLKIDGRFICLGPNIKYVNGAYWDFWDHFIPLTEISLSEVLKLEDFEIELIIPRFLPYSMSTGKTPPLFLLKMYLKIPIIWRFFGKQFLVIGSKKASKINYGKITLK